MARVKINGDAISKLMAGPKAEDMIAARTEAVEEACARESSWGGYASAVSNDGTRARGRVWSYARQDGRGRTERAQRLIRNLDAQ